MMGKESTVEEIFRVINLKSISGEVIFEWMLDTFQDVNITLGELRRIVEAHKENRLITPEYKIGTKVWIIYEGAIFEVTVFAYINDGYVCTFKNTYQHTFQTVYKTEEEAYENRKNNM